MIRYFSSTSFKNRMLRSLGDSGSQKYSCPSAKMTRTRIKVGVQIWWLLLQISVPHLSHLNRLDSGHFLPWQRNSYQLNLHLQSFQNQAQNFEYILILVIIDWVVWCNFEERLTFKKDLSCLVMLKPCLYKSNTNSDAFWWKQRLVKSYHGLNGLVSKDSKVGRYKKTATANIWGPTINTWVCWLEILRRTRCKFCIFIQPWCSFN